MIKLIKILLFIIVGILCLPIALFLGMIKGTKDFYTGYINGIIL